MTSGTDGNEADQRFPDLWAWLPGNSWLYGISAAFLLIIWLFFPVVFILGIIILVLWLVS